MTIFFRDYQIAAGYNNAAGLVTVETLIAPTASRHIVAPTVRGGFSPGQNYARGHGLLGTQGFARVNWHHSVMHYENDVYWRATFCGSEFSGLVTVRTRLLPTGPFAVYNAVLTIDQPVDRAEDKLWRIEDYISHLTRMVAI